VANLLILGQNYTFLLTTKDIGWGEFPLILAPMEDVTDPPFRSVCKMYGADVLITEFISSEGLIREAVKSTMKLSFAEEERPIGVQIFGHDIRSMMKATEMAEKARPDFIDINFGCPVKKVVVKGAGAALLTDVPKMIRLTEEVVRSTSLQVTVKTRLGWDETSKNIVEVAEKLQDTGIRAISIHGRTRSQLYGGKADWTLIGKVKENPRMQIPIIGNGDINSARVAKEMKDRYGVDGLMIGRAAIGNPWLFREIKAFLTDGTLLPPPSLDERIRILKLHLELGTKYKGEIKTILEIRKFYSGYFRDLPDFKKYRMKLMTAGNITEVNHIISAITSERSSENGEVI
jgi:tRNA-dihydrouridine synthase B